MGLPWAHLAYLYYSAAWSTTTEIQGSTALLNSVCLVCLEPDRQATEIVQWLLWSHRGIVPQTCAYRYE